MKHGTGILVRAISDAVQKAFEERPSLNVEYVLAALEALREKITEEMISRSFPELVRDHPWDKKRAPHELRPEQKRPPEEDLDRPISA